MSDLTHIPAPVVRTILAVARDMRDLRGDQAPNQWLDARYALVEDIDAQLRRDHGLHCRSWVRAFVFRIAN